MKKKLPIILTSILISCISSADALYAFTISKKRYEQKDVADNPGG
jgi:hypothetical protein